MTMLIDGFDDDELSAEELLTVCHKQKAEIAEHKKNMVWALKMLYDQEKGNPVYEEMCSKYFCKGKELR